MAKITSVTLTVKGKERTLSTAQKLAALMAAQGKASGDVSLVWPMVEPCYLPKAHKDAEETRRRNFFDALDNCESMEDAVIRYIVAGATVTVVVESGVILAGDPDSETYANVVAQDKLQGICGLPGVIVDVAPDAEDPREWVDPR